ELKQVEDYREAQKKQQFRSGLGKVALVGYTNAGKSSLMNTLLRMNHKEDKQVLQKDMLFATLDTSVRKITYKNKAFLLYDTVGFVSDLPHELIEAFKSTLDAARDADLLVIVNDLSDEQHASQLEITQATLKEIKAEGIEQLIVYNKADLVDHPEGLCISCKEGTGLEALLDAIVAKLYPKERRMDILLPYQQMGLVNKYQEMCDFELIEHREEGSIYTLSGSKEVLKNFDMYCLQSK
ncbi:MAG: 50S ribosome-binding GTPase, partial [Erysipelotrichaceae bacterium]|nr:50S ribosome-binding GTPase [Erysipelotrichaceae bacterium]